MVGHTTRDAFHSPGDWLTAALPRSADACYRLFCDVERTPAWLPILASAVVTERDPAGRPRRVAFQASLVRASIGYSCRYSYYADGRQVAWSTPRRSSITVRGVAQFQPVSAGACVMTYALDLHVGRGLPPFANAVFGLHASSATLAAFRDFAQRALT